MIIIRAALSEGPSLARGMRQQFSLVVEDDRLADRIDTLAREYELPTQEVIRQLVETGLEEIED